MSIDVLQDKIRKQKNPSMVSLELPLEALPTHFAELAEDHPALAYGTFCKELLKGLKGIVPAVRIPFGMFALLGEEGCAQLSDVLKDAGELGYYVLLDGLFLSTPLAAQMAADALLGRDLWHCDGVVVPVYLGSDCVKPFLVRSREQQKDLFLQVMTSNKSAPEIQNLRTGTRLVHSAAMDLVNRFGESLLGKYAYSQVAAVVGAGAPEMVRALREKYPHTFFLTDGYDYPNGNAKKCSVAFDRLGRGAVACAGSSVTAAWKQAESDGTDYVEQAAEAAQRMKKNLTHYVTVL